MARCEFNRVALHHNWHGQPLKLFPDADESISAFSKLQHSGKQPATTSPIKKKLVIIIWRFPRGGTETAMTAWRFPAMTAKRWRQELRRPTTSMLWERDIYGIEPEIMYFQCLSPRIYFRLVFFCRIAARAGAPRATRT